MDFNPDLRADDDGVDRGWTFVVETRTSDRMGWVVSVTVVVLCDESWVI